MRKIKVWLDDERKAPIGYLRARTVEGAIEYLKTYDVTEISLDHDLGDDDGIGTGYDVLTFIEKRLHEEGIEPPIIHIHTANPSARKKMELAVKSIERYTDE